MDKTLIWRVWDEGQGCHNKEAEEQSVGEWITWPCHILFILINLNHLHFCHPWKKICCFHVQHNRVGYPLDYLLYLMCYALCFFGLMWVVHILTIPALKATNDQYQCKITVPFFFHLFPAAVRRWLWCHKSCISWTRRPEAWIQIGVLPASPSTGRITFLELFLYVTFYCWLCPVQIENSVESS